MKVLVLGGGDSPEREVSLRSAKAVADAAREAGYDVEEYDTINGFEFLDKIEKSTIVFPIFHGINGEDGIVQAALEQRGLPFLGADSAASAACLDKWLTLQAFKVHGVPTPKSEFIRSEDFEKSRLRHKPYVLKAARGGSSIGVLIARDPRKVTKKQIKEIFDLDSRAVIEELIEGTEITVPVLDKTALPVIEIIPPKDGDFDYENKYNGKTTEICPPKTVSKQIQHDSQRMAEIAHQVRNVRHLSRTDFMIDESGNLYAIDINTMPGLTKQSLFPKSAAVAGYTMTKLVNKFVEMVKRDYGL